MVRLYSPFCRVLLSFGLLLLAVSASVQLRPGKHNSFLERPAAFRQTVVSFVQKLPR